MADLKQAGAMQHTTVVAAPEGCGLGERYAALCSALSIAERARDQGGHSFVILDDISIMVQWLLCIPTALLTKNTVLILDGPYSKVALQTAVVGCHIQCP